jgi:hypothetical protein
MRRFWLLSACLVVLASSVAAAQAAGSKGTISRSWISTTSGGTSVKAFSAASGKRLYANFVWKKPAAPGQVLRIEWRDPAGTLRAVWRNKTIADDKKGTRLYAWINGGLVKGKTGSWNAVLTVGGSPISSHRFTVTA